MSSVQAEAPTPPISVIESLASGFDTVAGHLWLMLIPLILDAIFLVAPRTSAEPVMLEAQNFRSELWLSQAPDEETRAQLEHDLNLATFDSFPARHLPLVNWTGDSDPIPEWRLLVDVIEYGVPVLVPRLPVGPLFFDYQPPVWSINSPLLLVVMVTGLPLAWALVGGFYRMLVAIEVRDERLELSKFISRQFLTSLNVLGYGALVIFVAIMVVLPFSLIGFALGFGQGFQLVLITAYFVVMWLGMFSSFTLHGVMLNDRWLLPALWDSVRVVQWNTWPTLFMWALVALLNLALTFPLLQLGLATDTWLVLPAIVIHAFVNTALVAASMIFYKDRHRHWLEVRALMLERLGRLRDEQIRRLAGRDKARPESEDSDVS